MNPNCITFQPPPQMIQPPLQVYQPPPQMYQPPPQTICAPPQPQMRCCHPPPPPPIIIERQVERPMYPPPRRQKAPKTKVIVIDKPSAPAPQAAPIVINSDRDRSQGSNCCNWCPGLFGLLGLLGLLCCLFHLFCNDKEEAAPAPAPQPIPQPQPQPLPPIVNPDTIDPIPAVIPKSPVVPEQMSPIQSTPIGIQECEKCDKEEQHSVDPSVSQPSGGSYSNPTTYVQPHSMAPTATNPSVAQMQSTGSMISTAPIVTNLTQNIDTVNPYTTEPIQIKKTASEFQTGINAGIPHIHANGDIHRLYVNSAAVAA